MLDQVHMTSYPGFSSFQECEECLWKMNTTTLLRSKQHIKLALNCYAIVLYADNYYLVGYSKKGEWIVIGRSQVSFLWNGRVHVDEYEHTLPILPYKIDTFCSLVYPCVPFTKAVLHRQHPFHCFRYVGQKDITWEPFSTSALGHTYARLFLLTITSGFFTKECDFSFFYSPTDCQTIKRVFETDSTIELVDPFRCFIRRKDDTIAEQDIFTTHRDNHLKVAAVNAHKNNILFFPA